MSKHRSEHVWQLKHSLAGTRLERTISGSFASLPSDGPGSDMQAKYLESIAAGALKRPDALFAAATWNSAPPTAPKCDARLQERDEQLYRERGALNRGCRQFRPSRTAATARQRIRKQGGRRHARG